MYLQIVCIHVFIAYRPNMDFNTPKSIINVHTCCLSLPCRHELHISSWASRTTACHIKSKRLTCFRNNIQEMSKPNRSIIKLLLGTSASVTGRDEGPLYSFAFFSSDTESVQSLLLRRFGIKSRTKMQHILTANHHGDADIFLKN